MFEDQLASLTGRLRRAMKLPPLRGRAMIPEWELSEAQVAQIRSPDPGPVERAFYDHTGRVAHKWTQYLPIYDRIFAPWIGKKVRMLEIGVSEGGSLELWRTVFGPEAEICGIDVDPKCAGRVDPPNRVFIGSQDDRDFLARVADEIGPLDIVLDDGSHIGRHMIASFETLFPRLSPHGVYVLEDLQPSYWPGYFEGGHRRAGTMVEYLKAMVDDLNGEYHTKPSNDLYRQQIDSIQFFRAVAVVQKCPPHAPVGHVKRGG